MLSLLILLHEYRKETGQAIRKGNGLAAKEKTTYLRKANGSGPHRRKQADFRYVMRHPLAYLGFGVLSHVGRLFHTSRIT